MSLIDSAIVVLRSLCWDLCVAIAVLLSLCCDRCVAIFVLRSLSCDLCAAIFVLRSLCCDLSVAIFALCCDVWVAIVVLRSLRRLSLCADISVHMNEVIFCVCPRCGNEVTKAGYLCRCFGCIASIVGESKRPRIQTPNVPVNLTKIRFNIKRQTISLAYHRVDLKNYHTHKMHRYIGLYVLIYT